MVHLFVTECNQRKCNGVMSLKHSSSKGESLWVCRKCSRRDTSQEKHSKEVYKFEREPPGDVYSPFSEEDPDTKISWKKFKEKYKKYLEEY